MQFIKDRYKGVLFCLCIALFAYSIVQLWSPLEVVGAPVISIVIGMLLAYIISEREPIQTGVQFTSKKILQYAIILLGFGLNLTTIAKVGTTSLPIIISTITTALVVSYVVSKLFRIPNKIATLIGVGSSICGGSAIAATAPVIDANDEEIAQAISVIFLFNVIAAIIFPLVGDMLHMSNEGFALFAGTAINDTSSVTAAASTWDSIHDTGNMVLSNATIVKLTRTLAIIPITFTLAIFRIKKQQHEENKVSIKQIFPMFILYFILASCITTLVSLSNNQSVLELSTSFFNICKFLSKFFIIMAMAAIGFNTDVVKLIKNGKKPILLGLICWIAIISVSLLLQHILQIW